LGTTGSEQAALQIGQPNNPLVTLRNGNMGLGTNNPQQKLQISGGNLLIQGTNSFQTTGDEAVLFLGDNSHYIKSVFGDGLKIGSFGTPDALVLMQSNGNVGIGTSCPSEKLSVNGRILVRNEVLIQDIATQWCDYVFEDNYKKMSYLEKEKYYKKHKHLPGIISAEEIRNNGFKITEVMAGITLNVEENRLDITDLYKKMEKLEKENYELNKKIKELMLLLNINK
jgi:hypothetical protein